MLSAALDDRFMEWTWADIDPYYRELAAFPLDDETVDPFLRGWAALSDRIAEKGSRLYVATTCDTADEAAEQRYTEFLNEIFPPSQEAEQGLRQKLLASGIEPAGLAIAIRDMRTDVALFREANLPLQAREEELSTRYHKITGGQTVRWEGEEVTGDQLEPVYQDQDRARRERAWRLVHRRWLADRSAINELWAELLPLRLQQAANAGFPDYRAFRWQQFKRFDYTPEDCLRFHAAIEEVIVPAASALYERRRRSLRVDTLRPWDLDVDPRGRPPLRPFGSVAELIDGVGAALGRVDPVFGGYFDTMRREDLLDLDVRKNKAPGGYCTSFPVAKRPFIFMRAVGMQTDVWTLMHESGHAFHDFESGALPYGTLHGQQGAEFSEVASMGMELLAWPYLASSPRGRYSAVDAARARREHLERIIILWPYIAVVDAFQMWVYEHPEAAADPARCDDQWAVLWRRFMPGVDWSGLEDEQCTGWHRKLHIHTIPFYYVEYGMAQLGAVQVWANAQRDPAGAVGAYRSALALGNTRSLPELYAAAGARLAFDSAGLREALAVIEDSLAGLEGEKPVLTSQASVLHDDFTTG